jgi:hypothetical protein
MSEIQRCVPTFSEFDGYKGMLPGTDDGYGRSWVLFEAHAAALRERDERIAALEAEIDGFPNLAAMRQCMVDTADENAALRKQIERLSAPVTDAECSECRGTGTTADYVGLEMRCVEVECGTCNGTGRTAARKGAAS